MMYHLLQCKMVMFWHFWLHGFSTTLFEVIYRRGKDELWEQFLSISKNTFDLKITSKPLGFGKSNSAKFIRIRLQKSFVSKLWRREAFNLDCIRDGKEGGPDNLEIRVGNCARINSKNVLSTWQQTKLSMSNNPWGKKSSI